MFDLLTEPLISVSTSNEECRMNLPDLLASLSNDHIVGYLGLRPHQAEPWHVFLVQVAASIKARCPTNGFPIDSAYWRKGLLDLSENNPSAWMLVVEDVTRPAFLQHPWKSWEDEGIDYGVKTVHGKISYETKATTPDELDVLVTAKNHDVKMARMGDDLAEAWLFALLLLQTTSGYSGRDNYGIIRMNSGTGSRSVVAWTPSLNPSQRFVADVKTLESERNRVCQEFNYRQRGTVLTWLDIWNRNGHQYILSQLEPWFIEACRPVRLRATVGGKIFALGATSNARQIGPKTLENGDVGDLWTPLNVQDKKKGRSALTLSADGYTPKLLTDLLFEQGFALTSLQKPTPGEGPGCFLASCLVRGQGKTEGFYRIELPLPPSARMTLFNKQSRETLAHLAQFLLNDAKDAQNALTTALTVLTEGGPDKADFEHDSINRWMTGFRRLFRKQWEVTYFDTLWRGAEQDHETVRKNWQQQLVNEVQKILDEAIMRLPLPSNRYWRSITQAQQALRGMIHKLGLPMLSGSSPESVESREESFV